MFAKVVDRVTAFGKAAAPSAVPQWSQVGGSVGELAQGGKKQTPVFVDENKPLTASVLYAAGNLDLALISPRGQRIDATTFRNRPDAGWEEADVLGSRSEVIVVGEPEVGTWTAEVTAVSVPTPGAKVPSCCPPGSTARVSRSMVASIKRP